MTIAFVQQKTNSIASGTSLVVTLDTAATVGNTLIATFGSNGGAYITGITGGGTWAVSDTSGAYNQCEIWRCPVDTGSVTAITITLSVTNPANANVSEFSGLTTTPQDTVNNNGATGVTITTGSVTPTVATNLVVAAARVNTTISAGPINSWTGLTSIYANSHTLSSAYLIQSSTTSASTGWTDDNGAFGWDAVISAFKGTEAATPTWTTPADTVSMSTTPELKFNSPTSAVAQHFYLQLDTANTFDTGNLRTVNSSTSQTDWAYWDGAAWTAMPLAGLPIAKSGNEIRYTVSSALSSSTWYRRVRAGTLI